MAKLRCPDCENTGFVRKPNDRGFQDVCDCVHGDLVKISVMLVGPKIASGNPEHIKNEIESLFEQMENQKERYAKIEKGICPDCEFWRYEVNHMREWTRPLYKKLREQIKTLEDEIKKLKEAK